MKYTTELGEQLTGKTHHYSISDFGEKIPLPQKQALRITGIDRIVDCFVKGINARTQSKNNQIRNFNNVVELFSQYTKRVAYYSTANKDEVFVNLDTENYGFAKGSFGYYRLEHYKSTLKILERLTAANIQLVRLGKYRFLEVEKNGIITQLPTNFRIILSSDTSKIEILKLK
jgi:hypothetical protein